MMRVKLINSHHSFYIIMAINILTNNNTNTRYHININILAFLYLLTHSEEILNIYIENITTDKQKYFPFFASDKQNKT